MSDAGPGMAHFYSLVDRLAVCEGRREAARRLLNFTVQPRRAQLMDLLASYETRRPENPGYFTGRVMGAVLEHGYLRDPVCKHLFQAALCDFFGVRTIPPLPDSPAAVA